MLFLFKNTLWALLFFCISGYAQTRKIDSLYKILKTPIHDTIRTKVYYNLGLKYEEVNEDSTDHYLRKAIDLSLRSNFPKLTIQSYGELGDVYLSLNELDTALFYYNEALKYPFIDRDIKCQSILNGIGNAYFLKGNYVKAYDYFLRYLNKVELYGKISQVIRANCNVGTMLKEQKKYDDALIFFNRALEKALSSGTNSNLHIIYLNMGNVYSELSKNGKSDYHTKKALDNYFKAKELLKDKNDKRSIEAMVLLLGNIGNIYADIKQYDKAISEFSEAVALIGSMDEEFIQASLVYNNLASVYIDVKNIKEAEKYLKLAYKSAISINNPDDIMQNYQAYSRFHEIKGEYKPAYLYQFRFKQISDSLYSTDNAEKRKEIELNAEFEKKEAIAKAEQEKREALANEEKKKQRIILYAFVVGFVLMLLVAFLIFRSYRQKQRANEIITQQKLEVEKQKHLVEEKQKEIIDSIRYAKRIQQSLMPTNKYIEKNMNKLKDKV